MSEKEVVEENEEEEEGEEGIRKFCYIGTNKQTNTVQFENREHPQPALRTCRALRAREGMGSIIFLHNSKLLFLLLLHPNPSVSVPSLPPSARDWQMECKPAVCGFTSGVMYVMYYNTRRFGALRVPPSSSCRGLGALQALQRGSSASFQSFQ